MDATSGYVTPGTAYAPGIGFDDPALADMPAYVGGDQIGTTRRVTDSAAAGATVIERTVYTAFGERVNLTDGSGNPTASPVSRYGYAGAWGYEGATCEPPGAPTGWCDPLTTLGWLHVGERYYDPAIGRFMQRDPIGIRGGLNVYEYVRSAPTITIDPYGLDTWLSTWGENIALTGGAVAGVGGTVVLYTWWTGAAGGSAGLVIGASGCVITGLGSAMMLTDNIYTWLTTPPPPPPPTPPFTLYVDPIAARMIQREIEGKPGGNPFVGTGGMEDFWDDNFHPQY